eukprot:13430778-Alexandrium_andersonii.AAC.1
MAVRGLAVVLTAGRITRMRACRSQALASGAGRATALCFSELRHEGCRLRWSGHPGASTGE